nr:glycosyltransferase [uncultured Desulfobacter sp.]
MGRQKKILFIGEDLTLAHLIRPYVLSKALDPDKYEVFLASGQKYLSFIKDAASHFIDIPTLPSNVFLERLSKGKPVYREDEIRTSVVTDCKLLKQLKPDLVVGDFRLSLGISAEVCSIPYIALSNAFWSRSSIISFPVPELPIVDLLGPNTVKLMAKPILPLILKYHARPFNRVRREYGLPPFSDLKEVYTYSDLTLYLDTPLLAPTSYLQKNHHYLGPLIWSPEDPLPLWWSRLPKDIPVIYVTVGSSGDTCVITEVLKAIKELNLCAMVSTAGRFESSTKGVNIFEEKFLPGSEAAKRSDIVICSGGTATTYQALACGTPVIGIPLNADQYLSMQAIADEGAGIMLRSGKLTSSMVKTAIQKILKTESFKKSCLTIMAEMESFNALERFPHFIEPLLET